MKEVALRKNGHVEVNKNVGFVHLLGGERDEFQSCMLVFGV